MFFSAGANEEAPVGALAIYLAYTSNTKYCFHKYKLLIELLGFKLEKSSYCQDNGIKYQPTDLLTDQHVL